MKRKRNAHGQYVSHRRHRGRGGTLRSKVKLASKHANKALGYADMMCAMSGNKNMCRVSKLGKRFKKARGGKSWLSRQFSRAKKVGKIGSEIACLRDPNSTLCKRSKMANKVANYV